MPPDPLAWHRPFGARSFVSTSKKYIRGPRKMISGGALPSFGPAVITIRYEGANAFNF